MAPSKPEITIIGAGLVGALLATLLAQRGFSVHVFERRPDPRQAGYAGGRSINLALAERGLHGLRLAGLTEPIMDLAVMMRGRMVHHLDGHTEFLRYGRDDSEVIWSINRGRLNCVLLNAAEAAGSRLHFDHGLTNAEFGTSVNLHFYNERTGEKPRYTTPFVIGADGAGSALRTEMNTFMPLGERITPLGHGYKELEIPPILTESITHGERFAVEPNALHIWPRGNYMCIALPNAEGSFTVTLFLPNEGDPSFATLKSLTDARAFFQHNFADALPLIPEFDRDFVHNPTGLLATLYLERWHLDSRALLVGDAAHAIVPFHGQGMNCGFEDAVELADLFAAQRNNMANNIENIFVEFEKRRRPNAEAIAAMALENYVEMRDSVADPEFLLRRQLERLLAECYPQRFIPRYWMVTFTRIPYALAQERGRVQATLLAELCKGKTHIEQIDLASAERLINERVPLLPDDAV